MRLLFVVATVVALLPAFPASASEQEIRNNIALGALSFADTCARCHQIDGYGEERLYPSLHSPQLLQDRSLLIQTILNGRNGHQGKGEGEGTTLMPSLSFLSDAEIVAIIAFITNSWGGEVLVVSEQEVKAARAAMGPGKRGSRAE
jgi:mono/diheme cytochrome c family protein